MQIYNFIIYILLSIYFQFLIALIKVIVKTNIIRLFKASVPNFSCPIWQCVVFTPIRMSVHLRIGFFLSRLGGKSYRKIILPFQYWNRRSAEAIDFNTYLMASWTQFYVTPFYSHLTDGIVTLLLGFSCGREGFGIITWF